MVEEWQVVAERHAEQIKTLFERQKEIKELTESVHTIAMSLKDTKGELKGVNERLERIEETTRYKSRTVWACLVTGVLGAAVAYAVSTILH